MRICLIEASKKEDAGSAGAFWIKHHAEKNGFGIDNISQDSQRFGYDVELISVHHQRDFERLVTMPKRGKIRIIGGHVTYTNPKPLIPLADVVCCGDGESWIVSALSALQKRFDVESLAALKGTIITKTWERNQLIPSLNIEETLPDNPPYLNRKGEPATWEIEIARGCPYQCLFCEIGHTVPFRKARTENILSKIDSLQTSSATWIRYICPEEGSHEGYSAFEDAAKNKELRCTSGNYRIEQILRLSGLNTNASQIIRVGVDGLSEQSRKRVNKRITNQQFLEYFKLLISKGHLNFKIFQMIYAWDSLADFYEFESVMDEVFAISSRKTKKLMITWTPFVPQMRTPMQHETSTYNEEVISAVNKWHKKKFSGWDVEKTRMVSKENHQQVVTWTLGDEFTLLKDAAWVHPAWRKYQ